MVILLSKQIIFGPGNMPVIKYPSYKPPLIYRNRHINTVMSSRFRKVRDVRYARERMELPDGDFLDLDWSRKGYGRVAIVCHGLEGHAHRNYVKGMVRALNRGGWDALALNYRGCSGEPNRLVRAYHSGSTEDLHTVVEHVSGTREYGEIALVGFSLGGNLILKYLGDKIFLVPGKVKAAAVVSTPCDLASSVREMMRFHNYIYHKRFVKLLCQKMVEKEERFPGKIDVNNIRSIRNMRDFDEKYSHIHGFEGADDYYAKASSGQFLSGIEIPTLILNARDDLFLPRECYPVKAAGTNKKIFLEMPKHGGHVGFVERIGKDVYWHERRVVEFLGGNRKGIIRKRQV